MHNCLTLVSESYEGMLFCKKFAELINSEMGNLTQRVGTNKDLPHRPVAVISGHMIGISGEPIAYTSWVILAYLSYNLSKRFNTKAVIYQGNVPVDVVEHSEAAEQEYKNRNVFFVNESGFPVSVPKSLVEKLCEKLNIGNKKEARLSLIKAVYENRIDEKFRLLGYLHSEVGK